MSPPGRHDPGAVRLPVVVSPRAAANELGPVIDGRLRIRVTAAPADGAANAAVCRVLADALGIGIRQVRIQSGLGARRKVVAVSGLSVATIAARLPVVAPLL